MVLTATAAINVCERAAQRGLIVARVEGGIWHAPGFEPRADCIWDGADPPIVEALAVTNNAEAMRFIQSELERHPAFVLTAPPLSGWPHNQGVNLAL
jgi:Colicin-E5 Imm protein